MNASHIPWRGAVLAGGESSRMGSDKALLQVEGEPLWRRQLRVLKDSGFADSMLVRRPGQPPLDSSLPCVMDQIANAGPLAGIHAVMTFGAASWLAVLAVDMPVIDASWFQRLRTRCRPGSGAVVRHKNGFEPLAAIYPGEAIEQVETNLNEKIFCLQSLVQSLVESDRMTVVDLPESDRHQLFNWNSQPGFIGRRSRNQTDPSNMVAQRRRGAEKTAEMADGKAVSESGRPWVGTQGFMPSCQRGL